MSKRATESRLTLKVGELVEVRSKEEILSTLDPTGCLDGLPFMPEMFACCGKRFRVFKRAHKTCDTATGSYQGRRLRDAVHLEGARCDGRAHGDCGAGCLIFWKTVWLRRAPVADSDSTDFARRPAAGEMPAATARCTEAGVLAAAFRPPETDDRGPIYVCQATQLPTATAPLAPGDWKQYLEDYSSGNVGLRRMINGFIYTGFRRLSNWHCGNALRWLYDRLQSLWGGVPYPRRLGKIPTGTSTPTANLNLQPDEWVRVKSYEAILATCNQSNENRGMKFDAEMVPYCGGTYRVLKRVTHIVDERTGEMRQMKTPCIILDGVACEARYSECRLFCPRNIYSFWREIWLERVSATAGPRQPASDDPLDPTKT